MKNIRPSFVFPILWLFISTLLLTIPGSSFPKENWFDKIWFDKWVHLGMFSIMVFLWCWTMLRINFGRAKLKRVFILFALLWFAYGIGMEFVQKYFVANRSFDVGDIIADGVGCMTGLFYSISRFIKN